ncbi:ATP-binding protein [Aquabacterium humicola]|uniref:ATP-binding protein n=1 Tax=Aquabacterium humicola TaxID=3237377 RepID=UPI0025427109|nr:ATP-binding protein [Rubrivivax pictus]
MRLRLVHTLSLCLVAAVASSVLAMGAVLAWNLRQGFGDYLAARDTERLETFAGVVADALRAGGGEAALQDGRLDMRQLLREVALREGDTSALRNPSPQEDVARPGRAQDGRGPPGRQADGRGPPGSEGDARRPPPHLRADGPPGGPPEARGERPRRPDHGFGGRVALFDLEGRRLAGHALPETGAALVERPVQLDGRTVAIARMRAPQRAPEASEQKFLRHQYAGITGVALGLTLLAVAVGWWLSRQWVRPLLAVQAATARIARGELDVRLPRTRDDEFGDVVHNVNLMAESLQRIEGARRRWIADLSHELRTPLAVLRGEIEAQIDGVRAWTPQAAQSLREEVLRLGTLVDDLHLLAMADLNALPCRFDAADAAALCRDAVQRFAARASAQRMTLTLNAGDAPLPVRWDAGRIGQLLGNLLQNSLRYTDAPGRIELALQRSGERVRITLDDSAPGVPAAELPRLFEPLYRAGRARDRESGGSGLGLAICAAIVQAHQGRIEALPSPLGGLRITVELPLDASKESGR